MHDCYLFVSNTTYLFQSLYLHLFFEVRKLIVAYSEFKLLCLSLEALTKFKTIYAIPNNTHCPRSAEAVLILIDQWLKQKKKNQIWLVLLFLWLLQRESMFWSLHCCLTEHWSYKSVEESVFHNWCIVVDSNLAIAAFQLRLWFHDNFKLVYVDAKIVCFPYHPLWQ